MIKKTIALGLAVSTAAILVSGVPGFCGDRAKALTTEKEKISYTLGATLGKQIKRDFAVDQKAFFKGFEASTTGKDLLMTDEEMQQTMMAFQQQMQARQMEKLKAVADKNKADGAAFLAGNKAKEGVVSLESGLQYKVIKNGEGKKPALPDTVTCNYRGTTIDGKEFDSSYKRGEPASFPVGGVIKGWTEALQLMSVGSKWMLYIPSELAYGDRGAGASIAPGSTLIFEIELLGIKG
ncbi:MAG: FKBP-type peptidyl-prolyl cis-trans isomerase [Desulfobacteraceae bacterium]|nr:FKBP-type peptidyl-prolyl cis-trans isomerase [Desulfobacteraceae bacterium]